MVNLSLLWLRSAVAGGGAAVLRRVAAMGAPIFSRGLALGVTLGLVLGLVLAGFTGGSARAQSGGSMGGGDWSSAPSSGGGSYSTGGSSDYSSGTSYRTGDSSSSDWSSSGGGGGGSFGTGGVVTLVVLGIGFVLVSAVRSIAQQNEPRMPLSMGLAPSSAWGRAEADVTVLRLALDARVRKFVQAELARIGRSADTATPEGRAAMLREVALLLRRSRDAWVYGGAVNAPMTNLQEAKQQFDRHVGDARGRFVHEVVRNAQGVITTADAPDVTNPVGSGPGLVVVTVVIAARAELFSVRRIGSGDDLRQALESASNHAAHDLIAIEIVWMPADEGEAISSIAVEARYPPPDLVKLQGALVGKVICQYCSGPFPAELVSCPHCGARATS